MKRAFVILIITLVSTLAFAQRGDYAAVDGKMARITQAESSTVDGIATYINRNFTTPRDKARAIFYWIGDNIAYDLSTNYLGTSYSNPSELVDKVMATRKGICMHYSLLYQELAGKTGIQAEVVPGYVKRDGKVESSSHSWVTVYLNGEWFLIDPTWGAGHILKGRYVPKMNDKYFLTPPAELVKSHMPFDPMWQLLRQPLTHAEFITGAKTTAVKPAYSFNDSIAVFRHLNEQQRAEIYLARLERNSVLHPLIADEVNSLKKQLNVYRTNNAIGLFNQAVDSFNEGIGHLNRFVDYRNRQFRPERPEDEVRALVSMSYEALSNTRELLAGVPAASTDLKRKITQLNGDVGKALNQVTEQQAFVDKYYSTPRIMRKTLFYKYTWMGIPLN